MNAVYQSGLPKFKYILKNMNIYHSDRRENSSEGIPLKKLCKKRDTAENKKLYKYTLKQQKTLILSLPSQSQVPRMTYLLEN